MREGERVEWVKGARELDERPGGQSGSGGRRGGWRSGRERKTFYVFHRESLATATSLSQTTPPSCGFPPEAAGKRKEYKYGNFVECPHFRWGFFAAASSTFKFILPPPPPPFCADSSKTFVSPPLSLSKRTTCTHTHTHTHTRIYTPLLAFLVSDPPALLGLPHPVQGGAGANKAMKKKGKEEREEGREDRRKSLRVLFCDRCATNLQWFFILFLFFSSGETNIL